MPSSPRSSMTTSSRPLRAKRRTGSPPPDYGNLTYADIIADFCTTTPTSAGAYVREQLIRTYNMRQTEREALEEQAVLIKALRISQAQMDAHRPRGNSLGGVSRVFPLDKDNG